MSDGSIVLNSWGPVGFFSNLKNIIQFQAQNKACINLFAHLKSKASSRDSLSGITMTDNPYHAISCTSTPVQFLFYHSVDLDLRVLACSYMQSDFFLS